MVAQLTSHGRKRKRDNNEPASKFQTKLHHGVKEAKKAAKLTKAFEVQRLVKRLKRLREKSAPGDDVRDAVAQLGALKAIDCESFAALALYRKLCRDKHIMSHPDASTAIAAELHSASSASSAGPKTKTAEAIVESRLASSKQLAKELNGIVVGLRTLVLGPNGGADEEESKETDYGTELTVGQPADEENEDASGASDDGAAKANDAGWESGSISQDSDGGLDESTDLNSEVEPPPAKRQKTSTPSSVHIGSSVQKKSDPRASHPSLQDDSVYLPSLSVGFTKGDSDISGDEVDSDAGSVGLARKNRRGQRARQQIWERKYGKNANHVKKLKEETVKENVAAAYGSRGRGRGAAPGRGRGTSGPSNRATSTGQAKPAPIPFNNKEGAPMHPSWEAAKKRKEQATVVPFQGKKIVF